MERVEGIEPSSPAWKAGFLEHLLFDLIEVFVL